MEEKPVDERPTAKSAAEVIMEKAAKKRDEAKAEAAKTEQELNTYEKRRSDLEEAGKEAIAQSMEEKKTRERKARRENIRKEMAGIKEKIKIEGPLSPTTKEKEQKAEELARQLAHKGWEEAQKKDAEKVAMELREAETEKTSMQAGEIGTAPAEMTLPAKLWGKAKQYGWKAWGWLRSL